MKNRNTILGIAGIIIALALSACPTEAEGDDDAPVISLTGSRGELELTLSDTESKFFDLATGTEITGDAVKSREWDISFYATRQIRTNSGITARENRSSGRGAVWHTEKTDFDDVVLEDAVNKDKSEGDDGYDPVYGIYNTDVLRYALGMAGYSVQPERFMNVMTYLGYPNQRDNPAMDGTTAEKMFQPFYLYDKRAFYKNVPNDAMPPNFVVTSRVYIIRHGDGEGYSKFQVTKFERDSFKYIDTYKVIWENF
jgi:hypothetical protein